jgi:hypothetical protein
VKRLLAVSGCLGSLVALPVGLYLGLLGVILGGGSRSQWEESKPYLAGAAGLLVVAVLGLIVFVANLKAFKRVEPVTHPRARD